MSATIIDVAHHCNVSPGIVSRVLDASRADIGEDLRLSRERVRQIKNKTLRRLQRSKEHKEKLVDFLEL